MKRFLIVLPLLFLAVTAHAATLTFDPQEQVVGTRSPFKVALMLSSTIPVNTVHITLTLPESITPVDVSDGNSIVNFWITNPHFDEATRKLTFEGVIPGGYAGEGGRVLVLTLRASAPGTAVIAVDPNDTMLYRNSPTAEQEPLIASPLVLRVSSTKENVPNELPDTDAPEPFTPLVAHADGAYGGAWILTFATQDKGSGIDRYEVLEADPNVPAFLATAWHTADSPYILTDQRLSSAITVRAIDKQGNVRSETIPPVYPLPWYAQRWISYILVLGALLLLLLGYAFLRSTRSLQSRDL